VVVDATFWISVVGPVVGILAAVAAVWQALYARRQARSAETSATLAREAAHFAQRQAQASERQAAAAERQIELQASEVAADSERRDIGLVTELRPLVISLQASISTIQFESLAYLPERGISALRTVQVVGPPGWLLDELNRLTNNLDASILQATSELLIVILRRLRDCVNEVSRGPVRPADIRAGMALDEQWREAHFVVQMYRTRVYELNEVIEEFLASYRR
jgi:hypothetical protein